jgi:hypothetical protein
MVFCLRIFGSNMDSKPELTRKDSALQQVSIPNISLQNNSFELIFISQSVVA